MTRIRNTGIATFAVIGAAVLSLAATSARAEGEKPREATITVSGEGQSSVAPDMAVVTLAVVETAKTAREALDANSAAMDKVLSALKGDGIADRDLQTAGFGIVPLYHYPTDRDGNSGPPVLNGYQVSNTLSVRLRDISKLGALLDKAVSLGINQGGDIRFTNDKPKDTITEARKAAVTDALDKAKILTEAAGVKLGRVIEISESEARPAPMPRFAAAVAKEASDAAPVPVAAGENTYSVNVSVTFAIGE